MRVTKTPILLQALLRDRDIMKRKQQKGPLPPAIFCVDLLQHLTVLCPKNIQSQRPNTAFWGGNALVFFLDQLQHRHVLCQKSMQRQQQNTAFGREGMLAIFC